MKYRDTDNTAFSAPVQVYSSTIPRPVTSTKIVEMSNGQLLIPLYGTPSGGNWHHAVMVASVDGGKTWDGPGARRDHARPCPRDHPGGYRGRSVGHDERRSDRLLQQHLHDHVGTALVARGDDARAGDPHHPRYELRPVLVEPTQHGQLTDQPADPDRGPPRQRDLAKHPQHTLYNPGSTHDAGYPGTVALDTTPGSSP